MAIRYDVTIDWVSSPRLLTVDATSVEISVQEIVDTCRYLEDTTPGENYEYLIDAAGKEPLGGTTSVGITATLNNCQIAFEARPGPNWVLCTISGGNIVAIDALGAELDPRAPTAFVTVDRAASSSATISEAEGCDPVEVADAVWEAKVDEFQPATVGAGFQTLLYGDYIFVDVDSGFSGTDVFGLGTKARPLNNINDAVTVADARKIRKLMLLSSITIEAGDDVSNKSIETIGTMNIDVTLAPDCTCNAAIFRYLNIQGEVSNGDIIQLENCSVLNLENFTGIMNNVAFGQGAEISLGYWATIIQATAGGDPTNEPEINIGTADLNMSHYAGNLKLTGKTGSNRTVVNADSINIIIASSCVAGTIQLLGVGVIEADNSGAGCTVDSDGLLNKETIADAVWEELLDETTHNVAESAGRRLRQTSGMIVNEGIAQGAGTGSNQIQLATTASSLNGAYDPALVVIISGAGVGQSRMIYQYDGSTKTATVDRNWKANPNSASRYIIYANPGREHVNEGLAQAGTINTMTLNTRASDIDDVYVGQLIFIRSGYGDDQIGLVTAYNGTTKIASVAHNWGLIPNTTSGYVMLPQHIHYGDIANAVWDEPLSDHETAGTYGAELATKADIAASSSTTQTTATSGTAIYYSAIFGDYTNTFNRDNIYWEITEDGVTGLTVEMTFNIPDDDRPGVFQSFGRYIGVPANTHYIELLAYNYEASSFEILVESFMPGGNLSDSEYSHEYFERNIDRNNNNEVKFRLVHNVTNYNASHILYLDYVNVTSIDVITAADIADAVWDESLTDHTTTGTYGAAIAQTLGLMHSNIYIDDATYDEYGNMISARVRTYSNAASVGTNNNIIETYRITSDGTECGKFDFWKQVVGP
jgi:hypothetical protein